MAWHANPPASIKELQLTLTFALLAHCLGRLGAQRTWHGAVHADAVSIDNVHALATNFSHHFGHLAAGSLRVCHLVNVDCCWIPFLRDEWTTGAPEAFGV